MVRNYDIYSIEQRVYELEKGGTPTPGGNKGVISEIVKETNVEIRDNGTHTINLTKKYTNPYVIAANAQPLTTWGGIICIKNVVYDNVNNTLTFNTYTNYDATRSQLYNVDWLILEDPDESTRTTKSTKRSSKK